MSRQGGSPGPLSFFCPESMKPSQRTPHTAPATDLTFRNISPFQISFNYTLIQAPSLFQYLPTGVVEAGGGSGWGLGTGYGGMAGGSEAQQLLGVVGTDQSPSQLALDYVFRGFQGATAELCFTLMCR